MKQPGNMPKARLSLRATREAARIGIFFCTMVDAFSFQWFKRKPVYMMGWSTRLQCKSLFPFFCEYRKTCCMQLSQLDATEH